MDSDCRGKHCHNYKADQSKFSRTREENREALRRRHLWEICRRFWKGDPEVQTSNFYQYIPRFDLNSVWRVVAKNMALRSCVRQKSGNGSGIGQAGGSRRSCDRLLCRPSWSHRLEHSSESIAHRCFHNISNYLPYLEGDLKIVERLLSLATGFKGLASKTLTVESSSMVSRRTHDH